MENNESVHLLDFPYLQMGRVIFNYEHVGINALRGQVVRNTISHFGRLDYNFLKNTFQGIIANRHSQGLPTRFADYVGWMSDIEVWGLAQLVPLALEWGLYEYIEDWKKSLDEWLDLFPKLQESV